MVWEWEEMNSKQKGKRGELEAVHVLNEQGHSVSRTQQFCGKNGDADIEGIDGVHIEVKRQEQVRDEVFLQQAEEDARPGEIPVVMYRRNKEKWKILLRQNIADMIYSELTEEQKERIKKSLLNVKNVKDVR